MNNVYDTANRLAYEIKESKEYKDYKLARQKINENPELKEKIDEFEKVRYEAQVLSIKAREEDKEKIQKLQELYDILVKNSDIKEYFDLETNVDVIVGGALCLENKYEEKNEEYLISHSQYMLIGRIEKINVGNNLRNS